METLIFLTLLVLHVSETIYGMEVPKNNTLMLRYGFHNVRDCQNFEISYMCIQKCLDLFYDVAYADKQCECTCYRNRDKSKYSTNYIGKPTKWRLGAPTTSKPVWAQSKLDEKKLVALDFSNESSEAFVDIQNIASNETVDVIGIDDKQLQDKNGTVDSDGLQNTNGTDDSNVMQSKNGTGDANGTQSKNETDHSNGLQNKNGTDDNNGLQSKNETSNSIGLQSKNGTDDTSASYNKTETVGNNESTNANPTESYNKIHDTNVTNDPQVNLNSKTDNSTLSAGQASEKIIVTSDTNTPNLTTSIMST